MRRPGHLGRRMLLLAFDDCWRLTGHGPIGTMGPYNSVIASRAASMGRDARGIQAIAAALHQ